MITCGYCYKKNKVAYKGPCPQCIPPTVSEGKTHRLECGVCKADRPQDMVKHYSLYVNGSGGINLCNSCQIMVCENIRKIQSVVNRAHLNKCKKERVA